MGKNGKPVPESDRGSETTRVEKLTVLGRMFGGRAALIEKLCVLAVSAERKDVKCRKEVLLPASYGLQDMGLTCHNGILEVRFARRSGKNGGPDE